MDQILILNLFKIPDKYFLNITLSSLIFFTFLSFCIFKSDATQDLEYTDMRIQNNLLQNKEVDQLILNVLLSDPVNLTNNKEDSIYGQIESFENNVYIVWQESVIESFPKHNYDIFFMKSEDRGKTFGKPINLSNNTAFSERPQIAVSKNKIFVAWSETPNSNNKHIVFTKSSDNGKTFSKSIILSNNSNSYNQEISVFNDNIYLVWQEAGQNKTGNDDDNKIVFKSSRDGGNTFTNSIELINNTKDSFPKVNSFDDNVYIAWNNEDKKNSGIFFTKSSDKGNNFDKIIKLSDENNFGESQIAVKENEVTVIWSGLLEKNIDNIYYVKSYDNGSIFSNPKKLSDKIIHPNNKNNFNELNEIIKHPVNIDVTNNNYISSVVWQNAFSKQNYDILLLLLTNHENISATLLNLSKNPSVSECPSISISDNDVYVIWEDYIGGNHEILFAKITIDNLILNDVRK